MQEVSLVCYCIADMYFWPFLTYHNQPIAYEKHVRYIYLQPLLQVYIFLSCFIGMLYNIQKEFFLNWEKDTKWKSTILITENC